MAVLISSTGLATCSIALTVPNMFASTSTVDWGSFDGSHVYLIGLPSFPFTQRS
jgi:hypothetical protein